MNIGDSVCDPLQADGEGGTAAQRPQDLAPPRCGYVVGIGASAGGLSPLERFFDNMPAGGGAAFVVVQHLSPDFKSLMKELLTRHTSMPIHRVEDGMLVEPNRIYLIPPKKHMIMSDGRLRLADQDLTPGHALHYTIDRFFESLANDMRERAIGVILSGTGSDGTRGIRAINEAGGLVMVQDPASAQFDGMPCSALATRLAHYIMPPDEIARAIHSYITSAGDGRLSETASPRLVDEESLRRITGILRSDDSIDFSHYRPSTLGRRIERRMMIGGYASVDDYVRKLEESPDEQQAMRNDLLISVTSFFRDPAAWAVLEKDVLPRLIADTPDSEPLRMWVTACSTGEEAYSLAMLAHEQIEASRRPLDVKIFATDIDRRSLEKAAAGVYPETIAGDIGPDRLQRFFVRKGNEYHVSRQLREMVIFARHNLAKDAPFTRMHMVTCRNVLIYMQPPLQRQVLGTLHYALRLQGVLLLGAAESLGELEAEFRTVDRTWKIFEKRRDALLPLAGHRGLPGTAAVVSQPRTPFAQASALRAEALVAEAFGAQLRDRDSACLLVGPRNELLHVFGRADGVLRVPEGIATLDVTKMVVREMTLPLSTALYRVREEKRPVTFSGLQFRDGDRTRTLNMRVMYHSSSRGLPDFIAVLLEPAAERADIRIGEPFDLNQQAAARILSLEGELQQTRENLQATIEELESTNEEQQATNEELLASNEELQSTNEELHSVNEELYTVNAEYHAKIQELIDLNNDMDNLLRSTNIGTVFLDAELHIRKFTPAATEVVNLLPHDVGRPIDHISTNIDCAQLMEHVKRVLASGEPIEQDVVSRAGKPLFMRIYPYRSEAGEIRGVVLTFVDISELKRALTELQSARQSLEERTRDLEEANRRLSHLAAIVECSSDAIVSETLDGRVSSWNRGAERLYGCSADEVIGRPFARFLPPGREIEKAEMLQRVHQGESIENHETVRRTRDGRLVDVSLTISPVRDPEGRIVGSSAIARDISDRARSEKALQLANSDLRRKHDELEHFAYTVSHDLKSPLVTIAGMLGLARRRIEQGQTGQIVEAIGRAEETAIQMRKRIDGLLHLSRIGRIGMSMEKLDLDELIAIVLDQHAAEIRQGNVAVEAGPLGTVTANRQLVLEVFENLIANALKYGCEPRGGRIIIQSSHTSSERRICVRDHGPGIDPAFHDRIFGLFVRLGDSPDGTGVGLAIVRRVMELHGGRAWVESAAGEGAAFWLSFPNTVPEPAGLPQ